MRFGVAFGRRGRLTRKNAEGSSTRRRAWRSGETATRYCEEHGLRLAGR